MSIAGVPFTILDVVIVIACLVFAVSGYRQGFVVGLASFVGLLGGGLGGMALAPRLVDGLDQAGARAVGSIAVVVVAAALGQALAGWVGRRVRRVLRIGPLRVLDALAGALLSTVAVLGVTWFLALALRGGPLPVIDAQVRTSTVITTVDRYMPDPARNLFSSLRRVLAEDALPRVFGSLAPERIVPVAPPPSAIARDPDVVAAAPSIVKVTGDAVSCNRRMEGTAFVVAPSYLITNAHVVAGVHDPVLQVGGRGARYAARVVAYDPQRDLALLYAPALGAPPLRFGPDAAPGDQAAVAGFPLDGPYRVEPARIRSVLLARGPSIYGTTQVTREVYSLYASVRPGNSGGPLLSADGRVYGVVFAKSIDDPRTGYALTRAEVASMLARAGHDTTAADTGACAA